MTDDTSSNSHKMIFNQNSEHERTYFLFLSLVRYSALVCVALLVAMAVSFLTAASWFPGFLVFCFICGVGAWLFKFFFPPDISHP